MLVGCGATAASQPAQAETNAVDLIIFEEIDEMLVMVVEQAFMIEALKGEIIALQEDGADYGYVCEVQPGESLWTIANDVLGDPYKWMTIYTMNYWIKDPNLIYPYQVLLLP